MSDDFKQRGGSPWGSPPGGGGSGNGSGRGPTPPDIDKIIRDFQEKIKKFFLKPKKLILGSTGIILFKPNIRALILFYLQMISKYTPRNL